MLHTSRALHVSLSLCTLLFLSQKWFAKQRYGHVVPGLGLCTSGAVVPAWGQAPPVGRGLSRGQRVSPAPHGSAPHWDEDILPSGKGLSPFPWDPGGSPVCAHVSPSGLGDPGGPCGYSPSLPHTHQP